MKTLFHFFVFILVLTTNILTAQNLVPNPSFEDYYTCPGSAGGLGYVGGDPYIMDWYSMNVTPDYMHYCAGEGASNYPPDNAWGYQEPYNGEAYVSILTKDNFVDEREYIAVELLEPLTMGQTYRVSFYSSDADGGIEEDIDCVSNNIGLRFLKNPSYYWLTPSDNNPLLANNYADINHSEILNDSLGWTLIEGDFIADDSYTHIAIGNFFDDENTEIIQTGIDEGCLAMYYIDQVCVVLDGDDCSIIHNGVEENPSSSDFTIYPNPSAEFLNIKLDKNIQSIKVLDMKGRIVWQQWAVHQREMKIDINTLSQGIYLLQIDDELGNSFFKKLIKE